MQNTQINPISIQHKCSVIIKKPKYILNDGWSWILSAVENGKLNENSTTMDIFNLKTELVKKNNIRLNQFLRSNDNKKGVLFDPCDYCIDIPYYIIGDSLNKLNINSQNYIKDDLYTTNDRIVSCNVSQEITTMHQCNIVLNNTDDIYTLKNEIFYNSKDINTNYGEYVLNQANTCVIEPNDEVEVYMSDWKGNLNCVFTGYVSNVALNDNGLQKTISLQCDDITKKLTWIYFNAQAGFDVREARGVKLSAYTENQQPLQLNEVVSNVLAETYCDIYKKDEFVLKLVKIYASAWRRNAYKQVIIGGQEQMVVTNTEKNTAIIQDAYYKMRDVIVQELKEYVDIEYESNYRKVPGLGGEQYTTTKGKEVGRIGKRATIDYQAVVEESGTFNADGYMQTPFVPIEESSIAFKIEGLNQIAWAWTTNNGSWDFLFSNYKRNSDFVREIANMVQYEFFSNPLGVIYFRPPNFNLPRAIGLNDEVDSYIQENYWLDANIEQYFDHFNTTVNDNKIYTRVNVIGQNKAMNITHALLKKASYAPQVYLNKYGLRMMPTVTKVGLLNDKACETYGELLLHKNNMNYELCSTSCVLNSNYTIGNPIFVERQLAVWYIGRVVHSFTAGSGCSTELTLTYKRTPLCLEKDLDKYLNDNKFYGNLTDAEIEYIKNNKNMLLWGVVRVNEPTKTNSVSVSSNTRVSKDVYIKAEYVLVWQPLVGRFYDVLDCLIDEQVDTINNINSGKKRVKRNFLVKKTRNLKVFNNMQKDLALAKAHGDEAQAIREAWATLKPVSVKDSIAKGVAEGLIEIQGNKWVLVNPIGAIGTMGGKVVKNVLETVGEAAAMHDAKCKYLNVPNRANSTQTQWWVNEE